MCVQMDKYEKVERPREEPEIKDNEIRITTKGKVRNSISYATTLFKVALAIPGPSLLVPLFNLQVCAPLGERVH